MHMRTPHHVSTKLAATASVVILGLSLVLSGCGRHTTNDGANAGSQPGNSTGQTGGASLTDLQNLSNTLTGDLGSLSTDENAANTDQSNQDLEVQP